MKWIKVDDRLPEEGINVLVWNGHSFRIAKIGSHGKWVGAGVRRPTHWMRIPEAPSSTDDGCHSGIRSQISNDRLTVDIEHEKEKVALLMQHFIAGNPVLINGKGYFVVDMKNEMSGENLVSVFYVKRAHGD